MVRGVRRNMTVQFVGMQSFGEGVGIHIYGLDVCTMDPTIGRELRRAVGRH